MTAAPRPDWHRRLTPVAAAVTLLMLSAVILSFIPVTGAEFAVEGRAQALSVDLAEAASMDAIPARESTITSNGVAALSTDPEFRIDPGSEVVLIASAEAPMTLKDVIIPERWEVDIEAPPVDALRIFAKPTAKAEPATITAHYLLRNGTVIRYQQDGESRVLRLSADLARLDLGIAPLDIRIRPTAAAASLFVSLTPSAARFESLEVEQTSDAASKTTAVGTIEQGKLWISHKGEARDLSLVDMVRVERISDGFLRPLVAEPGSVKFGLRGIAETLVNTPGTRVQSLKPSLLDYLVDSGLLKILFAIFSFVIGVEATRLVRR